MQRRRLSKVSAFAGERKPKRRRVDAPFLLKNYNSMAFAEEHRLDNVLCCAESGSVPCDKQRMMPCMQVAAIHSVWNSMKINGPKKRLPTVPKRALVKRWAHTKEEPKEVLICSCKLSSPQTSQPQ